MGTITIDDDRTRHLLHFSDSRPEPSPGVTVLDDRRIELTRLIWERSSSGMGERRGCGEYRIGERVILHAFQIVAVEPYAPGSKVTLRGDNDMHVWEEPDEVSKAWAAQFGEAPESGPWSTPQGGE